MDPLSHALVGGLAAKTARTSKRRFWIMVFLGSAPDLDVLFNGLGGWAFMLQHRGLSHSFVGVALQAFFWAWALGKYDQGEFKVRALHYSFPIFFHLVADYLTCYGVPLFAPFSFHEYSADLIHSVNVVPMVFMGIGLAWMSRRELHGWKQTRLIWAGWVVYLGLTLTSKTYASHLANVPSSSITTVPSIANPFSWHGIYKDENTHAYHSYDLNLIHRHAPSEKIFAMPSSDFPVQASLRSTEVQTFLRENRWPVVRTSHHGEDWHVEWGTVLFSSRGIVRGKVAVDLDKTGSILHQEKILNFWDPA